MKKNFKKVCGVLVGVVALTLTGCSSSGEENNQSLQTQQAVAEQEKENICSEINLEPVKQYGMTEKDFTCNGDLKRSSFVNITRQIIDENFKDFNYTIEVHNNDSTSLVILWDIEDFSSSELLTIKSDMLNFINSITNMYYMVDTENIGVVLGGQGYEVVTSVNGSEFDA